MAGLAKRSFISEQTTCRRAIYRLMATANAELPQQLAHIVDHAVLGHAEDHRYLPVGFTDGDPAQAFEFTVRERRLQDVALLIDNPSRRVMNECCDEATLGKHSEDGPVGIRPINTISEAEDGVIAVLGLNRKTDAVSYIVVAGVAQILTLFCRSVSGAEVRPNDWCDMRVCMAESWVDLFIFAGGISFDPIDWEIGKRFADTFVSVDQKIAHILKIIDT